MAIRKIFIICFFVFFVNLQSQEIYPDSVVYFDPQGELNKIYTFLGEESFPHSFENLSNQHREDDITTYGLGDMHEVHSKLEKTSSDPSEVLPDSIIELYNSNKETLEFWKEPIKTFSTKTNVVAPKTTGNSYNLFSQ